MTPDLLAFFDRYRQAFDALDGDAVAALYAEPAAIVQGGRLTIWPDRTAVRDNMRTLCAQYRARGYRQASFEPQQALPLGMQTAWVDLRWRIEWFGDAPPWQFGTAYQLMRADAGWQVQLCTAYEEDQLAQAPAVAAAPLELMAPLAPRIEPLHDLTDPAWLGLRRALWPDSGDDDEHREEMAQMVGEPARYAQFLARDDAGTPLGFVEAALRTDYVPGTETSPVAFLEGLYVSPAARGRGVARALVGTVEHWARARACQELASDTPLDNLPSQQVHRRLGFGESERLVCFSKRLAPGG